LDFDPIKVSTNGLRDLLLDQQVQQAKQLQMQNYIQQMSSNPTLASVLFQPNNRLLQHHAHHQQVSPAANRLLLEAAAATFNGRPPTIASLAGLASTNNVNTSQPEQMAWPSLGTWTNFLQRSGFGFENGR